MSARELNALLGNQNRRNRQDRNQVRPNDNQNAVPQAPAFFLTPFQATVGVIDYRTSEGRKTYERATKQLDMEQYDGSPNGMFAFLDNLGRRASEHGWSDIDLGILMIPININDPTSPLVNLLTNYGEINLQQIRDFEASYIH